MICDKCKKEIGDGEISGGMNLPGVTDGPVYFCRECLPSVESRETIEWIKSFIDPPKETNTGGGGSNAR